MIGFDGAAHTVCV